MKKIGFYGGTFDPIHFGHLFLAIQLAELKQLDEVWICPAFCSPFKQGKLPLTSGEHRLEMVRLAIEEIPRFKVLSSEVESKETSYTVDTLRALPQGFQYHLLLSEESALQFMKWKEPEEIARLAPPLIGCRKFSELSGHQDDSWKEIPFLKEGLVLTKRMEISSTEIRERLKNKLYVGHLVPAKALDYIRRHQLYFR